MKRALSRISCFLTYYISVTRFILVFACLVLPAICSFSQQLNWAFRAGGAATDISTTVSKDNAGNIYIAGKFSGSNVDFDPGPGVFTLSSVGGTDCFVAKYDTSGQFQWAFRFGGASLDEVHGIAFDQSDNFFITGYFRGSNIDFDPGPGVANLTSNGDAGVDPGYGGDIFIAKYNSAGNYQWAFNIGGVELYDAGIGISTDAAGNVYVGGYYTHTADFDPGPGTAVLNSAVSGSIFLAKYSNAGVYQWAFGLGSPVTNNALHDIKTDALGNVYVTGYYQGTNLDFDPGPGTALLSSNGGYEIFVAKYDANSQYQFAISVGGPGWDVARGIGLDNSGNIYVIGDFNNTVDFDPGPGVANISSNGQGDAFLAKYSPTGQYMWAFGFGGTPNEYGSKVIIDNAHVFITGSFTGTADLDPSAGVENLTSAGGYDIYLGKYTLDGEYLCAFRVGGPQDDGGYALVSTAPNVFCMTGAFSGTNIDFDPSTGVSNLSSAGAEDIFLTKYTWPDNPVPSGTISGSTVCSGEQAQLTFTAAAGVGPFTIVYSNGTSNITQTNVQSGVPFNITPNPTSTTVYTLVSIRDAQRCSESNYSTSSNATVIVNACSAISGIINNYTEVLAFDPCKNTLTVGNGSAFNPGDTVLMIQMKGAVIDSSNSAAFGTITDYKNAGNYEFNYVKSRTGNVIELKNKLTRQYNTPDGKVQLIRVPYYQDAVVSSALTCLPWDGSKGGVLVFNVADSLQLEGDINVSGKGFKGGLGYNSGQLVTNCFTNGYYYPSTSGAISGIKGESISTVSNNIIRGKGALAGAGGGGLDHNSGGGGGGNGGAGGFGGYQLEPCGNSPFDNRGIGGNNLSYSNTSNKIFMGSGGGAGHANNPSNINFPPSGGNGGGIVIISAQSLKSNSFKILSNGADAPTCPVATTGDCHDAMGGGGAGGVILLNIPTINDNSSIEIKGGKGADMSGSVALGGRIGAGGGGGGGLLWSAGGFLPANLIIDYTGGLNGVLLQDANNPWGAIPGTVGLNLFNLQLPVDSIPFTPNIDSVRIKDSITGCSSFDFKGLGYTNTNPVTAWQWYFGDGNTANTQNTSHIYNTAGTYTVKLVVTDSNGCKDSITKDVTATSLNFDFNYQVNTCNPLTVQFNGAGIDTQNPYWSFGDAATLSGTLNPVHTYSSENNYIIKYSVSNGVCSDTVKKTISLAILPDDIILTHDTTICFGTTKQLLTKPALSFCWNPITYLNDPNSPNPVTSAPQNITYYYTAEVTGNNLITNGDFSQGNTGFTSQYNYATPNVTEGQYFVGTNPQAWNGSLSACGDHTTGTGNMMMINGAPTPDVNVWKQTVTVTPNTNYAFSTWLQALWPPNPAQLRFSINGKDIGTLITASLPTCTWTQFYTTWNSGNNTSAVISIVNKNTAIQGNDFALDDISFAPVFIKRDSVKIIVDTPVVRANGAATVCQGTSVQLNTTGAVSYSWSPAAGLSNTNIANPVATPLTTTQYIVTGTNANGCTAKDSVMINVNPKPVIRVTDDTSICKNSSVQLFVSGGSNFLWSPAATLSNPIISNPIASPTAPTTYYVTISDANSCTNIDSVKVDIRPDPVFNVSAPASACEKIPIQLTASGGNIYSWQPSAFLSNPNISNPVATPPVTTNYSVQITETNCNTSSTLTTTVTVLPLPPVQAAKSNDLDCSYGQSQLNATGAVQYSWTPSTGLNNPNIAAPLASPLVTTQYIVKGTDAAGCINYDSVTVNILAANKSNYDMPNAFTPNGDGINDCYGIRYWGVIQQLEFSIYNRWGERVFYTTNPNACWDGTYKGTGQDIGVYVYMIKAKTICGDSFRKGLFTLIR